MEISPNLPTTIVAFQVLGMNLSRLGAFPKFQLRSIVSHEPTYTTGCQIEILPCDYSS
jgi:hypothetical protein